MKKWRRKIAGALVAALCMAGLCLTCHMTKAEEPAKCVVDNSMLESALKKTDGLTKIMVSSTVPTGASTVYSLNVAGTAKLYIVGTTGILAPSADGGILALTGDCEGLFSAATLYNKTNLLGLVEIDLRGLDTSGVTSISSMFYWNQNLEKVDITGLDFSSVETMNDLFESLPKLAELNVDWSVANTKNVTNMNAMFYGCSSLTEIDLRGMITNKVTDMSMMFYECNNAETITMNGCNTDAVKTAENMFKRCEKVTALDLTGCSFSAAEDMGSMFEECRSLKSLDLSSFSTENCVSMKDMFANCYQLEYVNVEAFDTAKVKDFSGMFESCVNLSKLNIRGFYTTSATDMARMFSDCRKLTSLDFCHFDTSHVTSMQEMFMKCFAMEYLDLHTFTCESLQNADRMVYMFATMVEDKLEWVDLSGFGQASFSSVEMFAGCDRLAWIDFTNLNFGPFYGVKDETKKNMFGSIEEMEAINPIKTICMNEIQLAYMFMKIYSTNYNHNSFHISPHSFSGEPGNNRCTCCGRCVAVAKAGAHSFGAQPYTCCSDCGECYGIATNGEHDFSGGICSYCGLNEAAYSPCDVYCSLSLKSEIEVNIAFQLSNALRYSDATFARFTLPDGTTDIVPISQTRRTMINGERYDVVSCQVAAKEMNDSITCVVYNENLSYTSEPATISVAQYANVLMNDTSGIYSDEAKDLVCAMLRYGIYAQKFFDYHASGLTSPSISAASTVKEAVEEYAPEFSGRGNGKFSFVGCTLVLNDTVSLRFYFSFSDSLSTEEKNAIIKSNSFTVAADDSGYAYYEVSDIPIASWGTKTYLDTETSSVEYCVFSYLNDVLWNGLDSALSNLMCAMYDYYNAAIVYQYSIQ